MTCHFEDLAHWYVSLTALPTSHWPRSPNFSSQAAVLHSAAAAEAMLLSPLTDSIRLSHFCPLALAELFCWRARDQYVFLKVLTSPLYIFQVAQNIFNHPITLLMKCHNLLAKCPNIHWHNVWVGSIELSQRVPAECHAAGAWYTQERVQLNNCIVPSWHWFDPCWFCTVASPSVFVSICALYWNSLPCTDSSTLRAMRLGVSHPKNVRLKGTQIWINTSNSIQGWNPSKPFSKRWIFETSRYISMHQRT